MKKVTLSCEYDETKLKAIKMFTEQKNVSMTDELASFMESMYRKHVPKSVRSFIDKDQSGKSSPADNKKGS